MIASWVLATVSAFLALVPFYYIWRIIREVIRVSPDYDKAQHLSAYGWCAVGTAVLAMLIYMTGLVCLHLAAFHVQATMLYKRESLIIFDEVQQFPRARQLIKYLVADGRFDYLETGSLIRLKKNVQDIIIPSEEDHVEMFPLDFEEFLWAMGDEVTYPLIRHCFETKTPLGETLHRKVMNDFRQYILVGGMPQSVLGYMKSKDFEASDVAKRRILNLYRAILFDRLNINEGMLMENIVAQMLRHRRTRLYFYSRSDSQHRENHMEIDFLITEGNKIVPVEVKSGNYRSHSSLDKFRKKFVSVIGNST